MEKMGFVGSNAETMKKPERDDTLYAEASKLLVDVEELIGDLNEETALLYSGDIVADPYEISRIKESPIGWYDDEDGIKKLREGVELLKEIRSIQNDASLTQEQRVETLKPKLVTLRENYGV